ncbi:MAG: 50S ribosomal protein L35 [Lachnospiraceae bacterium]|jgi:large subunit ribosomal protein L35|nr:50S ribosomal protein L35 [Lachnospiraceae bacterium]
MPKLKTNRAAAKRFKATGTGKIKRMKAGKQHILTKKSQKMKRRLRKGALLDSANMSAARKMLPYA